MSVDELDDATRTRSASLFAALRAVRRELREIRDERSMFERTCRHAVSLAGFRFAWIGVVEGARVVPVASAGEGGTYLDALHVTIDASPLGAGPTGTAVREARAVFCPDIEADPIMTPWREHALAHGFRSSGAIPVKHDGHVRAVLNLYRERVGFADSLEKAIAESLAEDLGLALEGLAIEAQRARVEEELRASEQRYRSLFENATDGIFVADASRRYVDVNPAGCRMLGYTREELLAMQFDEVLDPLELGVRPSTPEAWPLQQPFTSERRAIRKDGQRIDIEIHGVRLPDGRYYSVTRDVSERKRIAAEEAANERILSLGRLAQGVGHEINNPLSYVMLNLEALRARVRHLLPEDGRQTFEEPVLAALDGAKRIAHIVRSLSSFGRADSESIGPVDPARVVAAAVSLTRNRLAHVAPLTIEEAALPPVLANEFGLTQVLVNLLLNAADALEDAAGEHRIRLVERASEDGRIALEVIDDGPGIPLSALERIFDPFFTTKAPGRGTGLGLAISRAIVSRFGGTLEAENVAGGGALFRVVLPVARIGEQPGTPSPRRAHDTSARKRILVVDDEPLVRKSIVLLLGRHEVEECGDIASARELCRRSPPDCILCDLMMPGEPGSALYETLMNENPLLARRMVFITGGAFTSAAQSFLDAVDNVRLFKPFTHVELEQAIEAAVAR